MSLTLDKVLLTIDGSKKLGQPSRFGNDESIGAVSAQEGLN